MKKYASFFCSRFPSASRGRRIVGRMVKGLAVLGLMLSVVPARAGSAFWIGGVDTNWSTGGNWSGGSGTLGVPGATDNVVFGPIGASPTSDAVSNYVDGVLGNFAGTIGSLQYTNAANFQNTLIAPSVTLNITGATLAITGQTAAGNALMVGQGAAGGTENATISGPGATLNVSNTAA
ncbi:MAG TPA: hypothetical protein VN048_09365, partial [Verrucomicrobiae bacterium]|nr:hypothetical protein [Verrucomicrobiae bacterium]